MTDEKRKELAAKMGPLIEPFERRKDLLNPKPGIGECEDFSNQTEDKSKNGDIPFEDCHLTAEELQNPYGLPDKKKFLWLIDLDGEELRLRIIPEVTENDKSDRGVVCHTNISACNKALQGGECWWNADQKIMYINDKSGRYGAETKLQWQAVLDFFREIGYSRLQDIRNYADPSRQLK